MELERGKLELNGMIMTRLRKALPLLLSPITPSLKALLSWYGDFCFFFLLSCSFIYLFFFTIDECFFSFLYYLQNTYNFPINGKVNKNPRIPAVAALINGDKCAFYSVGFSGIQDTLWDADGRHFFHRCTIRGAVDFIFGNGQSIYKVRYILTLHITMRVFSSSNTSRGLTSRDVKSNW